MAWYTGIVDTISDIGGWLKEYPEAATLIGGIGSGLAQGYFEEKAAKREREARWDEWEQRRPKASLGNENYAVNVTGTRPGLLSDAKYLGK